MKLKTKRIFLNSFFDFKLKNEFEYFDFCFLKLVLNQNRLKENQSVHRKYHLSFNLKLKLKIGKMQLSIIKLKKNI